MKNIAVLGAGGWGIALSKLVHENGCNVKLWEFDPAAAAKLADEREEKNKLPGVMIPEPILITCSKEEVLKDAEMVLIVVPSKFFKDTAAAFRGHFREGLSYVIATKGVDTITLKTMNEVLADENPHANNNNSVILSGPSHAEEVGKGIPTTVVAASPNTDLAQEVQETFSNDHFRVYTNEDIRGVALAGSLKNVIAIAAGIGDGLGFGDNAKGALLTRGIVEIARLGQAMGAHENTFMGLAGIGDLITTCISRHSRNRYVGEEIGKGKTLQEVLGGMVMVSEGVETAKSAYALSQHYSVDMPITEQVYQVLFENKNPYQAVNELMLRDYKDEGG